MIALRALITKKKRIQTIYECIEKFAKQTEKVDYEIKDLEKFEKSLDPTQFKRVWSDWKASIVFLAKISNDN